MCKTHLNKFEQNMILYTEFASQILVYFLIFRTMFCFVDGICLSSVGTSISVSCVSSPF